MSDSGGADLAQLLARLHTADLRGAAKELERKADRQRDFATRCEGRPGFTLDGIADYANRMDQSAAHLRQLADLLDAARLRSGARARQRE